MSISTEISRIQTATNDIKTAIAGKGVTVPAGSKIDTLPALITSIPSGGGGGGDLDALIQRTITEIHSGVTSIGANAFRDCSELTTADFPLVTSLGDSAFQGCSKLTTADFPLLTSIGSFTFRYCSALITANFPLLTSIGSYVFQNNSALITANFPLLTSIGTTAFQGCSKLTTVDFPLVTSLGTSAFNGCTQLSTLILRKNAVCTLANINALTTTPISSGTGYVYVPASLVNAYKAATNWVTYANQIRAIENYPEITGG